LPQPIAAIDCQEPQMTRIRDIAQRAGVSTTTVSHVLNESRHVHPDTRERVLEAVRVLDYKPNMLARSLRRRQTQTIGLLVSDITNPFFADVARAVETAAYERGYSVILCNTDEDIRKEVMYVDALFAKQVDGLILAPSYGDHAFLRPYLDYGARIVIVNRSAPDAPVPVVVADDEQSSFDLADRLLSDGRRLGAIVGLRGVSTTEERLAGLSRALVKHGQSLADVWMHCGQARREGGYKSARELSQLSDPPSAVIAFNSLMLDGILLGLLDVAPHLLRQIEVTGFGYSPVARACQSARYYVAQPARELGLVAATLLLDVLAGVAPWRTERIVLKNQLLDLGQLSLVG
jgi:LacI family transcriptional regulator, fructose operon transcriptional repressor